MHGFQNNLAQLFIGAHLQNKGVLMLYSCGQYPHPRWRARQVSYEIQVQFLRLGPFLSNWKGKADNTWPTFTPR